MPETVGDMLVFRRVKVLNPFQIRLFWVSMLHEVQVGSPQKKTSWSLMPPSWTCLRTCGYYSSSYLKKNWNNIVIHPYAGFAMRRTLPTKLPEILHGVTTCHVRSRSRTCSHSHSTSPTIWQRLTHPGSSVSDPILGVFFFDSWPFSGVTSVTSIWGVILKVTTGLFN